MDKFGKATIDTGITKENSQKYDHFGTYIKLDIN